MKNVFNEKYRANCLQRSTLTAAPLKLDVRHQSWVEQLRYVYYVRLRCFDLQFVEFLKKLIQSTMDFESDPAADFLSREREELGGIIDDNGGEKL